MGYYVIYGAIVGIGAFFVYFFIIGGRIELAQELTKMTVAFGFFTILLVISYLRRKKMSRRIKDEIGTDEEITHINSRTKWLDRVVSVLLGLTVLFIASYNNSFDSIDVAQMLLVMIIHFGWHYYLFLSRKMPSFETVSALTYLDKMKDYTVLLFIPITILISPIFGRSFSSIDILQALAVFIAAYGWHKYLFFPKQ